MDQGGLFVHVRCRHCRKRFPLLRLGNAGLVNAGTCFRCHQAIAGARRKAQREARRERLWARAL